MQTTESNITDASAAPTAQPAPTNAIIDHAMKVARCEEAGIDEAVAEIWGASNDYNAKGRGSTEARRVLRNGSWEWLSKPASRGRYLAGDRRDTTYGNVFEGEIVATFTLGGNRTPSGFSIVAKKGWSAEKPDQAIMKLDFVATKSGYRLTRSKTGETIEVSDPYWK